MHFGENQLSPSSIGISPLSTAHPPVLQHWWVRASTRLYPRFTLAMGSSLGFGSGPGNSIALFGLAFATAPGITPLTLLPRQQLAGPFYKKYAVRDSHPLRQLVSARFQVLFHSPHRGSFRLSLTVLVHYRSSGVFSLGQWSALLPTVITRVPWYSGYETKKRCYTFRLPDYHRLRWAFPDRFC